MSLPIKLIRLKAIGKRKVAGVKHIINACFRVQRKEFEEQLIEKMKELKPERELRKEVEIMFQQK